MQELLNNIKDDAVVPAPRLRETLQYLRDKLHFDHLAFTTAIDKMTEGVIEAVYRLYSYKTGKEIVLRVRLDRAKPEIDTISDIYRTAEWHERETAEMFGILYHRHPDTSKLLLPDDILGFPLRKDFKNDFIVF